jgi:hypothetical protein
MSISTVLRNYYGMNVETLNMEAERIVEFGRGL